ncbi:MAG: (d)CMP kinase [Bacteroidales bacterium]|nr:(d)CMP kinase [Bacteroidales bacterium]MBN2820317.1 (d)CMP kinase [Bacteroidales bacterium]
MKLKNKIVIAVDGFSSCGKSTFAKLLAKKFGYIFIDTGAMYRAVSLFAWRNGLTTGGKIEEQELISKLQHIKIDFRYSGDKVCTFLNNENVENEIRGVEVSNLVSEVSKIKEVRKYLVSLQQAMGKNKGIVMDGRDIGTVVFPDAEVKLYMTATSNVRAKRRYDELIEKGFDVSFEEIKKNIEERDNNDMSRKESPLMKADDAIELDNSNMTVDEQVLWFNRLLLEKGLAIK